MTCFRDKNKHQLNIVRLKSRLLIWITFSLFRWPSLHFFNKEIVEIYFLNCFIFLFSMFLYRKHHNYYLIASTKLGTTHKYHDGRRIIMGLMGVLILFYLFMTRRSNRKMKMPLSASLQSLERDFVCTSYIHNYIDIKL